jgi:hypothetical protein
MKTLHRIQLLAPLQPVSGRHLTGWVEYLSSPDDGVYRLEGEVTVPFEDFAALGLDPQGGFDDEEVVLMLPAVATVFEMMPARIARTGVIFNVVETGTGLPIRAGDRVTLRIHTKVAAAGQF